MTNDTANIISAGNTSVFSDNIIHPARYIAEKSDIIRIRLINYQIGYLMSISAEKRIEWRDFVSYRGDISS